MHESIDSTLPTSDPCRYIDICSLFNDTRLQYIPLRVFLNNDTCPSSQVLDQGKNKTLFSLEYFYYGVP